MATDLDKWEDRGLFDIGSGGQEPSKIEEGDISNLTYQKREKENAGDGTSPDPTTAPEVVDIVSPQTAMIILTVLLVFTFLETVVIVWLVLKKLKRKRKINSVDPNQIDDQNDGSGESIVHYDDEPDEGKTQQKRASRYSQSRRSERQYTQPKSESRHAQSRNDGAEPVQSRRSERGYTQPKSESRHAQSRNDGTEPVQSRRSERGYTQPKSESRHAQSKNDGIEPVLSKVSEREYTQSKNERNTHYSKKIGRKLQPFGSRGVEGTSVTSTGEEGYDRYSTESEEITKRIIKDEVQRQLFAIEMKQRARREIQNELLNQVKRQKEQKQRAEAQKKSEPKHQVVEQSQTETNPMSESRRRHKSKKAAARHPSIIYQKQLQTMMKRGQKEPKKKVSLISLSSSVVDRYVKLVQDRTDVSSRHMQTEDKYDSSSEVYYSGDHSAHDFRLVYENPSLSDLSSTSNEVQSNQNIKKHITSKPTIEKVPNAMHADKNEASSEEQGGKQSLDEKKGRKGPLEFPFSSYIYSYPSVAFSNSNKPPAPNQEQAQVPHEDQEQKHNTEITNSSSENKKLPAALEEQKPNTELTNYSSESKKLPAAFEKQKPLIESTKSSNNTKKTSPLGVEQTLDIESTKSSSKSKKTLAPLKEQKPSLESIKSSSKSTKASALSVERNPESESLKSSKNSKKALVPIEEQKPNIESETYPNNSTNATAQGQQMSSEDSKKAKNVTWQTLISIHPENKELEYEEYDE